MFSRLNQIGIVNNMCGIAGIISLNGLKVENGRNRVKKMLDSMSYRGPDGSGIYEATDKWNNQVSWTLSRTL